MATSREIAEMHEKQNDGSWKKVAEQDVTDFGFVRMMEFCDIQNSQGRVIILKEEVSE